MALFRVGLETVDVLPLDSTDEVVSVVGLADGILVIADRMIGVDEVEIKLRGESFEDR